MGGIGYKLPAALFRGLQAICERVEFPGEDRQLVVSTQLHFMGVISRPNDADRGKDPPHSSGKRFRKNQGKKDNRSFQNDADPEYIVLQSRDQCALIQIIFHHVHGANEAAWA